MLENIKWNVSQPCACVTRKANCILGYVRMSAAIRSKEVIPPQYSPLVRPHVEGVLGPVPGSPAQETGESPVKSHEDDCRSGESLL